MDKEIRAQGMDEFPAACASPKLHRHALHGFFPSNRAMPRMLRLFFGLLTRPASSRRDLVLKNLALRQQLVVLSAQASSPEAPCTRQALMGPTCAGFEIGQF